VYREKRVDVAQHIHIPWWSNLIMRNHHNAALTDAYWEEVKRICAGCGIHKICWRENNGEGYSKDEEIYCCRDCAEEIECICNLSQA
jgi:hypothetical protein